MDSSSGFGSFSQAEVATQPKAINRENAIPKSIRRSQDPSSFARNTQKPNQLGGFRLASHSVMKAI
jgi:hypothetical protein